MPRRRLYYEELKKKSDNATTFYLKSRIVDQGLILFVVAGSAEDETNAPTTIAFGKMQGDRFTPFEENSSLSAGVRYHITMTHHFIAGEQPAWRFEGTTLNDICSACLEGYYEEVN